MNNFNKTEELELHNVVLGPEDIEKRALEIAQNHLVGERSRFPKWFTTSIKNNYQKIVEAYKEVSRDTGGGAPSSPTSEWILDNFYIIEEQFKDIKYSLAQKEFFQLPLLRDEALKGSPRIYALALELVTHTDGTIDEETLVNFIKAYQSRHPLYMGELWAVAVMLRIALIEKVSRICGKLMTCHKQRQKADEFANQIIDDVDKSLKVTEKVLSETKEAICNSTPAFIEHLVHNLRKYGKKTAEAVRFIDQTLAQQGISLEELINSEHQLQAVRQVSMGNSITSLRTISVTDWNEIFETLSKVEDILKQDPAGVYHQMDFESRDYYRHVVEKKSKFYNVSEIDVAYKVLECAMEATGDNEDDPVRHVGYYLIGSGSKVLDRNMGVGPGIIKSALSVLSKYPYAVYFGTLALLTLSFLGISLGYAVTNAIVSPVGLILTGFVLLIPLSDIAINIVNFAVSNIYSPILLPKLALNGGISKENSTMVIIPTLLPDEKRVKELLEKLEIYYLANREEHLYFALVGDFKDAERQETSTDNLIVETALNGLDKLNRRYSKETPIFYYFHRRRIFNEAHRQWMGWERKRGAILEFNDLLKGSRGTSYHVLSCDISQVPQVKHVITLDADTSLSLGAAKRLIGTMAHPMNKPVIDQERGIVTRGYGILQPRIGVGIDSAGKTLFSKIFAGQGGIDPYTTAVSDVYQDLFGEGIFTGKGIYHLDTFQAVLKDAIPENSILSHDLLEGSYIRAGLVTDVELIDGYPARYNSFSMRLHRWVRGDWQLIPWLSPKVRDKDGNLRTNPLSALSKWKMIDNLRRSLLHPALFILITLGFSVLPGNSLFWLGLAIGTVTFPTITYLAGGIMAKSHHSMEGTRGQTVMTGVKSSIYQAALQFIFIAYQTYLMIDAIIKTVVRLFFTRKNLLEWIPAADLEALLKNDMGSFFRKMGISPALGLLVLGLALISPNSNFENFAAAVVFGLWAVAPYAAYRVSREYVKQGEQLDDSERMELRRLMRKTWTYFEDLLSERDNYLPPDNLQVNPPNGIAHRTSPTNIGLAFVSTLAARDFGYIGTVEMVERISATLSTIEKMEKWEGHLYNWYDTTSLRVLRPRYVSTVDSGNFVGYLMVLEEGLKEYLQGPLLDVVYAQGLLDTVRLFNEEIESCGKVIDTRLLEAFIDEGRERIDTISEVLEFIESELSGDDIKPLVKSSLWGRKILAMISYFRKDLTASVDSLHRKIEDLLERIRIMADNTKFVPLFDSKRQLFSIGYNVEEGALTKSYYDLLASEARLASYIAIARGEVDKKHWFRLGRKLTQVDRTKGLVSWSGTMFEYFMPLLVMRNFENSLLDSTYEFVVKVQKKYGQKRQVPWGISESAYYAFDVALNYQYKAFGVPELGFKRGLGSELVISPYAAVLAINIDPKGTMQNLQRLKAEGLDGNYGFYESVDYTPVRAGLKGSGAIVQNFMVHHQGMIVMALSNYFNDNVMQRRFHAKPQIRSAEVLLQERMPLKVNVTKEHYEDYQPVKRKTQDEPEVVRNYGIPASELPNVHLLSNGNYSVMVTDGGSGYSKYNDMGVARWKETNQGRGTGFFIYVQNINSNNIWSATFEPLNVEPEEYRAVFSPDKAEFIRTDGNIETHTQIVVSPEDNAEVRTVTLTNNSQHHRVVEVTSYLEAVLTHPDADLAHPAFSNLFVTTEFIPQYDCLLAVRRPRTADQKPVFALHTVSVEGEVVGDLQYETDRARFIGRNRGLDNPQAMDVDQPLSYTVGAVLDPIMSLRRRLIIEPGHSVRASYTLAVAQSREEALVLADKYRDSRTVARAYELAWNRSKIEADYLDIKARDIEVYLDMIPSILYVGPARRRYEEVIAKNKKGQPSLWPFGISGDLPIVLVAISDKEQVDTVQRFLKAHEFWRMKGLKADLVFMAEDKGGYVQPLQDSIKELIFASHARELMNQKGGVYLLNANAMEDEEKILIYAASRLILNGDAGSIEEQLVWERPELPVPNLETTVEEGNPSINDKEYSSLNDFKFNLLKFFNGIGGFSSDGKEYVVYLREGQCTPAPWINVIANSEFGFNVTEVGAGYTWAENSRENKLTPWNNDPVSDVPGEVFYLRDEQNGKYWSLTPEPVREKEDYIIRHGQGYTCFEHVSNGIEQKLTEFAALKEPVKICLVELNNLTGICRNISLTYYMRPVMGVNEKVNAQFIKTDYYEDSGLFVITNSYNSDYPGRVAFIASSETDRTVTGDGNEFIGINGSLEHPAAMKRRGLSGETGAGLVPCGAMQVKITLKPGESTEIVFLLGQGKDMSEALVIAGKYTSFASAQAELGRVKDFWAAKLGVIQVETPDKSMNILLNSWLQYQVISCRLWSRAAFYQSGGAYGFRDQLQDVMAVAYTWPELTRKQILRHCAHQFLEGDVQHWWHPGANKGIRTRYSDDFLWLPYVTVDYINRTDDWSILDEVAGFLEDEPLPVHEDERYNIPRISEQKESVYNHCIKSIENGLKFGEHGLALMGSGDWNDGMNTVGNKGKGESVWLSWFLYTVLKKFVPVCIARNDNERADKYSLIAANLAENIEKNAWDGSWYRRAYFDNGKPLGSAANSECKIDSIAQSWSVISGIGRPHRTEEAMKAVDNYLIDREAGIIKLLTPPFGEGDLEPGYIKSYVPGVRENGGQYTHAAVWTIMAFAKLGYGDKAGDLFNMINPINHTLTSMDANRYKVEPYVVAADVYAVHPNTGRGGWSWYTGAAGWMYRVGVEHILGIVKAGSKLYFNPCIPRDWNEFRVEYKLMNTLFRINIQNPERVNKGVKKVAVDGQEVSEGFVLLTDDGKEHVVEVIMGKNEAHRNPQGKVAETDMSKWKRNALVLPVSAAKGFSDH